MSRSAVLLFFTAFLIIGLWLANLFAADGKTIFESNCAICHAPDGKGQATVAVILKVDLSKLNLVDNETMKKSDAKLTEIIRNGTGKQMRPFKNKLSSEEISAVVKYIRSLRK